MLFSIMAVFGLSALDTLIDFLKKKYKLLIFVLTVILCSTLIVIYKNDYIQGQKIQFTEYLIDLQNLEAKKEYHKAYHLLEQMKSTKYLTYHQKLLIEFYDNKLNLLLNKKSHWTNGYISRVNLFKDPNNSEGFIGHLWNKLGGGTDDSFSCIGELSLIMESTTTEDKNFLLNRKAQSLPNYLLWYIHMKKLYKYDPLNARMYLLQTVLYAHDYTPYELFKAGFRGLLLSLKPL